MSDLRTAAQQALEAWEYINKYGFVLADYEGPMEQAITALRAALEQPEQEPVAIVSSVTEPGQYGVKVRWLGGFPQIAMKLYTHPPRREWQGLTEEEIISLANEPRWPVGNSYVVPFVRDIEAALKERNL